MGMTLTGRCGGGGGFGGGHKLCLPRQCDFTPGHLTNMMSVRASLNKKK